MASPLHTVQNGKVTKTPRPNRKYNPAWEAIPEFANWLNRSPYSDRAWCILCERELRTHMTDLKKHRESVKHQRKEYEYENNIVECEENEEVIFQNSNFRALFKRVNNSNKTSFTEF